MLHTWSRDLAYHPHVHLLATAGGLTDHGEAWRKPAHSRFLVPGYALSKIFRAKVRDALERKNLLHSIDPAVFRKPWNVHVEYAGDGEHAAEYLSQDRFHPNPESSSPAGVSKDRAGVQIF